ncbi:hypothetical protein Acife_1935 [Acidithiobacillus ferrivorans SS3]|uniref:Uncharacterized protein n=1 Tax=Acidithiobacillus ferrivorans SS3 TaxID=743299 RepID=G0JLK9_9PROT|nr:hypothetical protein [Acidithiobacillus ferrivorans]AEM48058.1 hypothetical protein Acife_1935 [Acidithiobacillus ferrivorans SS3]
MEEKRSETNAAAPLSTGELAAYGLKSFIGFSLTGQLHAVYGSSKPGRNQKGGQ